MSGECADCGAVHFLDFIVANNHRAGIEWLHVTDTKVGQFHPRQGPGIKDAVIIGHLQYTERPACTMLGLVLPFQSGRVFNVIKLSN